MDFSHRPWRSRRTRPDWWPENQDWPPRPHFRHNPFFRRAGCMFMAFNLLGLALLIGFLAFVADALGLAHFSFDVLHWAAPLGAAVLVFMAIVLSVGSLGMRRISVPLDNLLAAAGRVAEGDTSVRVEERGPREVRSLTRAFNNMASRLQQVSEQRRALLADVTHELRTPLTVLQGNLEGMLDGVYPADEASLRSLLEETTVLSRLVEDLRTLALAESGALELKKEPTDLGMLVRETAASLQSRADEAGVTLRVEAVDGLPVLDLDPGRIRQVFTNLLTNALRYTPSGGTVTFRYRQAQGHALIEVQDSGPGIPPGDLPHIFERFYKSTDSGGMGLGLAIARHLVEAHGGTIRAASAPGQGTTMQISLPAA